MPGPVFLRGDEVTLHPVERADLDFLRRHRNDPAVRYGMTLNAPQNEKQAEDAFERHAEDDSGVGLLICAPDDAVDTDADAEGRDDDAKLKADRDDDADQSNDADDRRRVGQIVLFDIDETIGRGELACWIAPDEHDKGYATAATALMIDYAFAERRFHKVVARALVTNRGSRTVLGEKLGLVEEGRHRDEKFVNGEHVDVVRYSILEDEWEPFYGE